MLAEQTDWRAKMNALAPLALEQPITSISGTASWMLLFLRNSGRRAGFRGRSGCATCSPRSSLLVHGGSGFTPYRTDSRIGWRAATRSPEVYAASGIRRRGRSGRREGMRLLLDRGIFFEFVRPAELGSERARSPLDRDRRSGEEYAAVL